ncbi:MAG: carbohydrate ABC transporter permease [Candidatus Flexifilum sp.]|jgi:multiple sugar transport system permease protein
MVRLFASNSPFRPSLLTLILTYIVLGFWSIVVLFPLYWLFITSFKTPADVNNGPFYLPFVDYQPVLDTWYDLLVTQQNFVVRPYLNTFIVAGTGALLALIIGAAASYALSRFTYSPKLGVIGLFILMIIGVVLLISIGLPWWAALAIGIAIFLLLAQTLGRRFKRALGNNDIAFWFISQRMLPPVATVLPIYIIFQQLGLLNSHLGMIIVYTTVHLPLVIWFMRDYFSGIPLELEESAFIDGASRYTVLWRIVLPLSMPGLIATFLIVLVFAWNEYTFALFLTGAETQTMPLLVAAQNATRGPQWWNISVLVTLMVTPLLIMAVVLERFIARGILVGAVKG